MDFAREVYRAIQIAMHPMQLPRGKWPLPVERLLLFFAAGVMFASDCNASNTKMSFLMFSHGIPGPGFGPGLPRGGILSQLKAKGAAH
jgi:hypothetical protein